MAHVLVSGCMCLYIIYMYTYRFVIIHLCAYLHVCPSGNHQVIDVQKYKPTVLAKTSTIIIDHVHNHTENIVVEWCWMLFRFTLFKQIWTYVIYKLSPTNVSQLCLQLVTVCSQMVALHIAYYVPTFWQIQWLKGDVEKKSSPPFSMTSIPARTWWFSMWPASAYCHPFRHGSACLV